MQDANAKPETTIPLRAAPYGGKNLNLLAPDEVLRELLMQAKREFDWWVALTDEQFDEVAEKLGGEWSAHQYMDAMLLNHLNAIISQLSRAPFTKELCK